MRVILSGVAALSIALTACSGEPVQQATAAHIVAPRSYVTLSDQGQARCETIGGALSAVRQLDGSTVGMCALPNGKRCSEGAMATGRCGL